MALFVSATPSGLSTMRPRSTPSCPLPSSRRSTAGPIASSSIESSPGRQLGRSDPSGPCDSSTLLSVWIHRPQKWCLLCQRAHTHSFPFANLLKARIVCQTRSSPPAKWMQSQLTLTMPTSESPWSHVRRQRPIMSVPHHTRAAWPVICEKSLGYTRHDGAF